jgi:hypothetical protein
MKITRWVSTAALSVLLGTTALVWAQDEHNDAKPPEEPRPEAARPARDEAKPKAQDEDKAPKQNEAKPSKQAEHAADSQHGRIPDDKFRSHFGRQHTFAVNRVTVVEGQRRFQYGGYWFTLSDAWPAGWAYTDDCYIDYIDGEYFLFDLLHPGIRIAVVVVL